MEEDAAQAESPEKRRRRPPLACIACRRRKVRCDRKMPCQNCVRARRTTSCTYVPDDRLEPREGTQGFHDGINGRSHDKDDVVSAPYLKFTGTPAGHNSQDATSENSGSPAALAERVRQLEQQLQQVLDSKSSGVAGAKAAPQLPHANPPSTSQFLGEEYWQIGEGAEKAQYLNSSDDGSSTRVMLAKSRYLGSSHWIHGITLVGLIFFPIVFTFSSPAKSIPCLIAPDQKWTMFV